MSRRQHLTAIAYDKKGKIISIGNNSYVRTHTVQAKYAAKAGKPGAVFLHAEIDALIKARGKPIHRIFVSRVSISGEYVLAKPCKICQMALAEYGVKIVEHT